MVVAQARLCSWCRLGIPKTLNTAARYCSRRCREAAWRAAHPEVVAAKWAKYAASHPGSSAARCARYRAAHLAERREAGRIRNARRRNGGILPGGYSGELAEFSRAPYAADRAAQAALHADNRKMFRENRRSADAKYSAKRRASLQVTATG